MIEKIEQKLNEILEDQEIRFAGFIDSNGELIKGRLRKDVVPFEDDKEQKKIFSDLAARVSARKRFDYSMGPVKYSSSRREKLVMMSFPLDGKILLITAEPNVNIDRLAYRIIQKLGDDLNSFFSE